MAEEKSGVIKPIIIGVATTVLATSILSYLNMQEDGTTQPEANISSDTEVETLRRRQAELEARLEELDKKELQR